MSILPHIYIIGILLSLFLFPVLFKNRTANKPQYILISLILLSICLVLAGYSSVLLFGKHNILSGFQAIFWFALPPLLLLYTKSQTSKLFSFKSKYLIYFSFPLYNALNYLLNSFGLNYNLIYFFEGYALYTYLWIGFYFFHGIIFSLFSIREINIFTDSLKQVDSESHINIKWLDIYFKIFLCLLIIIFFRFIYLIHNQKYENSFEFLLVVFYELFILILTYKAINTPDFFKSIGDGKKYVNSKLTVIELEQMESTLIHVCDNQKPYLNKFLKLSDLSKTTDISENNLSQLLNQKLNLSFYDFINKCRVEEVKKRLVDPKFKHYKIESIAEESGFNSMASFYRIFKKSCKMTPSQFIKAHKK